MVYPRADIGTHDYLNRPATELNYLQIKSTSFKIILVINSRGKRGTDERGKGGYEGDLGMTNRYKWLLARTCRLPLDSASVMRNT